MLPVGVIVSLYDFPVLLLLVLLSLFPLLADGDKNKCLQQDRDGVRYIHRAGNQLVFCLPGKFQ